MSSPASGVDDRLGFASAAFPYAAGQILPVPRACVATARPFGGSCFFYFFRIQKPGKLTVDSHGNDPRLLADNDCQHVAFLGYADTGARTRTEIFGNRLGL